MRVLYMGTPQLAATVLDELHLHHEIVGVFTRPDAVRGRGKKLVASSVKSRAMQLGLDVFEPKTLKTPEARQLVESLKPDVICVAAYGCILPKAILDLPVFGCLNVHTSLLPRWRGAAPIERAILAHDEKTGVCIMRMEEGLDTGPYCLCKETEVGDLYLSDLRSKLSEMGAKALVDAIRLVEEGKASWTDQGEGGVTYAHKLEKSELVGDPSDSREHLRAKVRVASESRPAKIQIAGRVVALEKVNPLDGGLATENALPREGEATLVAKRLVIGVRDGVLELAQVKPDGKKSMEGRAFAAGIQGIKGTRVEWGRV